MSSGMLVASEFSGLRSYQEMRPLWLCGGTMVILALHSDVRVLGVCAPETGRWRLLLSTIMCWRDKERTGLRVLQVAAARAYLPLAEFSSVDLEMA